MSLSKGIVSSIGEVYHADMINACCRAAALRVVARVMLLHTPDICCDEAVAAAEGDGRVGEGESVECRERHACVEDGAQRTA